MKLENKLKAVFIAGSLAGVGLNLTSCKTYETCPAYKQSLYGSNIEMKIQNYKGENEIPKFSAQPCFAGLSKY